MRNEGLEIYLRMYEVRRNDEETKTGRMVANQLIDVLSLYNFGFETPRRGGGGGGGNLRYAVLSCLASLLYHTLITENEGIGK